MIDSSEGNFESAEIEIIPVEVTFDQGEFIAPDGTRMLPDGTLIFLNGVRVILTAQGGGQVVLPDGRRLKAGERAVTDDGTVFEQVEQE